MALAGALPLGGCGAIHDMRAEYVANRALVDVRAELWSPHPDRDIAVSKLDLIRRLRADDPVMLAELSDWYFMIGEFEQALVCLEGSGDPNDVLIKLKTGLLRLKLGDREGGETLLDEALQQGLDEYGAKAPGAYAAVLNGVGYAFVDAGVRVDEGMRLIEAALALQPLQPAYIDSLGWAYYRQGDFRQAAFHLEQAARLYPIKGDAEVLWHLGAVHARLHEFRRAEYELKQALALDPSNQEARRMLRGLQLELPVPARV